MTVKAATFNADIERARASAEAAHLPELTRAYELAILQAGALASDRFALTAAADWQPPPEGATLTAAQLATLTASLDEALRPVWAQIILETANKPLARIEIAWDITHPVPVRLLEQQALRLGGLYTTAVEFTLRDTIAKAYEQGLDVRETSALIRANAQAAAPFQADMLARTNLNSLANGASKAAAQEVGVQFKTWVATFDDKTRPEHVEAHGQSVPLTDTFVVGGEEADYPCDPNLSDAMACNCRCTLAYADTLDEANALLADAGGIMGEMDEAVEVLAASQWISDLAFEGMATDDGRYMMPGAIEWRELPIPLMALTATGPGGHEGAFQAGKITAIERDSSFDMDGEPLPAGVTAIRGHGVFDMGGDNGAETERLVRDEFVRGVSLDPAGVDAVLRDPETGETFAPREASPEIVERAMLGELQTAFTRYMIGGATVCPIPAFANARIALAASAIWMPIRLLGRAESDMLATCTCSQHVQTAGEHGPKKADEGSAEGATTADASLALCPIHSASTAASRSSASEARKSGRRAAVTAGSKNGSDGGALSTRRSARSSAPNTAEKSEKRESDGRKLSEGVVQPTLEPFDTEPESLSSGTNLKLSWKRKETAALSAASGSPTSPDEGHSRILTWTTRPEASSYEPGSADPAIEGLAASATTPTGSKAPRRTSESIAPLRPPRDWLFTPELPGPCPLTIAKDGRVYGHIALFESCHTGLAGQCVRPPRSPSGYAHFHVGHIETDDDELIPIGKLMLGTKHAPLSMAAAEAGRHYDDNGMVGAYIRATDGQYGIWVAGVLKHDLSPALLRDLRANPPSGDWRAFSGNLDLVAALAVPVPGYPVPRAEAALLASAERAEVAALIATPGHIEASAVVVQALIASGLVLAIDGCECDDATAEREMGVLAVRAESGMDGLVALIDS